MADLTGTQAGVWLASHPEILGGEVYRFEAEDYEPAAPSHPYGMQWVIRTSAAVEAEESGSNFGRLEGWRPLPDGEVVWFLPGLMSYGDYHGSAVEASNYQAFVEDWRGHAGVVLTSEFPGCHGIALAPDLMSEEDRAEILEVIEGLEGYCVLDESGMSALEFEREGEAWNSGGRADFARACADLMDGLGFPLLAEEWRDLASYGEVQGIDVLEVRFREACDASNTYPEHETGGSVYWDFSRIAAEAVSSPPPNPEDVAHIGTLKRPHGQYCFYCACGHFTATFGTLREAEVDLARHWSAVGQNVEGSLSV